jgi:hypothetical protein
MIEWAAGAAGLDLKAHPHMLRHASGYALANRGHDTRAIQAWLGHRSITSSAVYTALAPNRFKDFWRDRSCQTLSRRPKPQPGWGFGALPIARRQKMAVASAADITSGPAEVKDA